MKIIVTGANGTVGKPLCQALTAQGHEVVAWDRADVPINNYHKMEHYLRAVQPDALYHLAVASQSTGIENESWLVTYEWTSELAWLTHILEIKFLFTSTVAVFSNAQQGPFTIKSSPDATDGYGNEKMQAESHAIYQNPKATVVRLGWQIGEEVGSNNMVDYLARKMAKDGEVPASSAWLPASSFLPDTVEQLVDLLNFDGGLYLLDANERWNFYQIASALNRLHGDQWKIVETDDFVFDQRMQDERMQMPALNVRLPALP